MISVDDFLKINRIDNLNSSKILALHSPRSGTKADLLRGVVYCGEFGRTMTSMTIEKTAKEIKEARYYYKCETNTCSLRGKSVRAGVVIKAAQELFEKYLFIKKANYATYT